MTVAVPNPLIPKLAELLGVDPKRCRSLTLRLCTDDVVTVRTEEYVSESQIESVIQCFAAKEYVLIERLTPQEREALQVAVEYVGSAFQVEHHASVIQSLAARLRGMGRRDDDRSVER